ncbi:hypothetical protein E9549_19880 [Blastococcus sp. MG754426]|uniref:hypothetical protein n=1 Tax=unclassified Blastococcus TaxID=2619396 RepID=UPI001EF06559|nr:MULTISPECIES: hypothetical protein [unclassified Blastococcus]MCF6509636.1 hypothetical protein [Blastococcus sp. MG754426]MCF6514041.1 hypothetical protein [Blastococcus sp. MG754427]MCF6737102.1 hypothetical protein [Blastococcus sp. KM273129]
MSENDPDPHLPDQGQGRSELGGRPAPDAGDPTQGGRRGQIGEVPSIAEDEPDDGGPGYPVGGGDITERQGGRVADPDPTE